MPRLRVFASWNKVAFPQHQAPCPDGTPLEVATQVMQYSRPVVERCVKYAYEYTRRRNSKKNMLTLVHKCNVLTHCGDLWVRVHKEMGDKDYPEIKQDGNHVDACTMWFVKQPEYYDVIVTENLFGDIITDLAAIIQGGMMMDTLGETKVAQAIDKAIHDVLASGQIKSLAAGRTGMGTREVGDLLAKMVS
jgi:3-isopropylmalate dehydrogenase